MSRPNEKGVRPDWGPTVEQCADAFRRGEKAPFGTHRDAALDAWAIVNHETIQEMRRLHAEVIALQEKAER